MSIRPDTATHDNFLRYQETQPTALQYYPGRVAVALLGEGLIRKVGLTDAFSFKGIEKCIGMTNFIPGANAQKTVDVAQAVANEAVKTTASVVAEEAAQATATATHSTWCTYLPCTSWNQAIDFISCNLTAVSAFAYENKEWIGLTAGFALTAAAINHLGSRKIKNAYALNGLSLLLGGAVVWTASNFALGQQVGVNALADIGLRMVVCHAGLKYIAAPTAQWGLSAAHRAMNVLRWNFSYTPPKPTKAKA